MANDNLATSDDKRGIMVLPSSGTVVGHLEAFDTAHPEKFEKYLERYELFCVSNGIVDGAKKTATLMTVGGMDLYEAAASVLSPDTVKGAEYDTLVEKLKKHFVPTKTVWARRVDFQRRMQGPDETAHSYMAALQTLANHCKFAELLDSMLISQFICGLRDEQVQRRLLLEKEGSVTKALAVELAAISENTRKQQKEIREEQVHAVRSDAPALGQPRGRTGGAARKCKRCGGQHSGECKYREFNCNACGEIGHLAKMCKQQWDTSSSSEESDSPHRRNRRGKQRGRRNKKAINCVQSEGGTAPVYASVLLGGQFIQFEVDSGSPYSVVSMRTFRTLFPEARLQRHDPKIRDCQGKRIAVEGVTQITINYRGNRISQLPLVVAKKDFISILGRNWFRKMGIQLHGVDAQEEATDSAQAPGVTSRQRAAHTSA